MKKKTWLYYLVVGAIMAGGASIGLNPALTGSAADSVGEMVSEATTIDD